MAAIRILLVIICLAFVNRYALSNGNLLNGQRLVSIARGEVGVKEATGNNDGRRVEEYLSYVGLKRGAPWCAAFVSWVHGKTGFAKPRTGWSPALFPEQKLVKQALPGMVFGIYFPELKRIAHCGFVERCKGSWVYSIEGNTNGPGGREGDGVYRKMRHFRTIRCFGDWNSGI